ncbi:MAG TPA: HAMP domain-containing sensor histidine kinase [Bacteroidales bacterium]|jgi:nitrogen fixation/metabolism regulation signal transduction histidine kinase|nr:HAMP domain-containing sensor histidine kinase [Bacteroidales bacterium]
MKFNRISIRIILRVLLQFLTMLALSYALVTEKYFLSIALLPLIIAEFFYFYHLQKNTGEEVRQFADSVRYRDFSRNFKVSDAPVDLQPLHESFNEINSTFKTISREKETQYQYLQKVLELVDTGILSYQISSGEIAWMNESLKKILQLPYLKTIHSLEKRDPVLYRQIIGLTPGERIISKITSDRTSLKVVISSTAFQTGDIKYKLVIFQNVNEALEETESNAWQKLLSVMTHEIMNSVAPISSLANTMQARLRETSDIDSLTGDMELAIDTIRKRSEGLLKFTQTYRDLNKITKATLLKVQVSELFGNIYRLMQPNLAQKNIEVETILKEPLLSVHIDAGLIEQVLINLILNAIEAVRNKPNPRIVLSAYTDNDSRVIIKVADNGSGMSETMLDKIFIPFFSTRKNGTGIGLNLCKQIMQIHKGTISVQSVENEGTAFYLRFQD